MSASCCTGWRAAVLLSADIVAGQEALPAPAVTGNAGSGRRGTRVAGRMANGQDALAEPDAGPAQRNTGDLADRAHLASASDEGEPLSERTAGAHAPDLPRALRASCPVVRESAL